MSEADGYISTDEEISERFRRTMEAREGNTGQSTNRAAQDQTLVLQATQIANMEAAISDALQKQQKLFNEKLALIMGELESLKTKDDVPKIERYEEIKLEPERVRCDEPLDMVKSVPEFDGKQENYVSWRQAATAAYKIFEKYEGSSRHYQAVGILKNKVRGPAAAALSSFNTVFNFHAILARLDFTYADKTPIHVIKQELSLSRQGELPLLKYYDEIERKLTLLTNKTIMTHDTAAAAVLNEQHREDALHAFVSGLKKSLKMAVFPAQPRDLPSALALAQEAESSNERTIFAATFARQNEEKTFKPSNQRQASWKNYEQNQKLGAIKKNPHFVRTQKDNQNGSSRQRPRNNAGNYQGQPAPEPMDVDTSSRFRQPTAWQKGQSNRFPQKINFMPEEKTDDEDYDSVAQACATEIEDELDAEDSCNFLG